MALKSWQNDKIGTKVLIRALFAMVFLCSFGLTVFGETISPEEDPVLTALQQTAKTYRDNKQYDQARQAYSDIIAAFPNSSNAVFSHKNIAALYIEEGNDAAASTVTDKLIADYGSHQDFAGAMSLIANYYRKKKNNQKALELYQYVIDNCSDNQGRARACADLAIISMKNKNFAMADAAANELLTGFSDYDASENFLKIAKEYHSSDDFTKALQLYQSGLIRWQSVDCSVYFNAGIALLSLEFEDFPGADAAADKLLADSTGNPKFGNVVSDVAYQYMKHEKYTKAMDILQVALASQPNHSNAIYLLKAKVECHIKMGDEAQADMVLNDILDKYQSHPNFAKMVNSIASQYRKAKPHLKVKGIAPQRQQKTKNKLRVAAQRQKAINNLKAIELYQLAIDKTPSDKVSISAFAGIAKSQIRMGSALVDPNSPIESVVSYPDEDAVIEILNSIYKDDNTKGSHIFHIGEAYFRMGEKLRSKKKPAEALTYYQKAIDVWKQGILDSMPGCEYETGAYLFSGICYGRLQQHQKAAEYFQKVIQDWPDYRHVGSAHDWYAECLEKMKTKGLVEADTANTQIEEAYKVIVEEYPDYLYRTNICKKLGKFYLSHKRWQDAINHYNSLKSEGEIPLGEVLYYLGRCYEEVGDKANAITTYTEFLKTNAKKNYREEVTRKLESLAN